MAPSVDATPPDPTEIFEHRQLSLQSWRELAVKLLDYVYDPQRRTTLRDCNVLMKLLSERWHVRCVDVDSPVQGIGLIKAGGEQLARFSIRMLYLLYPAQYYIAVNPAPTTAEKRFAIVHELGHLVLHFEVLQSIGTLYHRICMNPELEFSFGSLSGKIDELLWHQEQEADLFAVTWLMPLAVDRDFSSLSPGDCESPALTIDGYRARMYREIFSDRQDGFATSGNVGAWNNLGADLRRRLGDAYPQNGSLAERVMWIVFNRESMKDIAARRQRLMTDYFNLVHPSRVPELSSTFTHNLPQDRKYAWMPRVDVERVLDQVDGDNWEPFLVCSKCDNPPYYVPITPVPSSELEDSKLEWVNMSKVSHSKPHRLTEWLDRVKQNQYGLMVFARTPAEKIIDVQLLQR